MAFVEGETIRGWGVFRGDPWHFDSTHETQADAQARAAELGGAYEVQFGANRAGTDDFVYGNIGTPRRTVQRALTLDGRPVTLDGRQLVLSVPAENGIKTLAGDTRRNRAYFIDEDRYTPSQFRRLSRARKVEALVQWFHKHYTDPADYVTYVTREGGYQWGGHGPYDADEELQGEFSDLADYDVIQEAVSEVTAGGLFEWAVRRGRDYTDDDYDLDLQFRESGENDGTYPVDQPFPDLSDTDADEADELELLELPPGQAFLTDENGNLLTDSDDSFLTTDSRPPEDGESVVAAASQQSVDELRQEMLARLDGLESLLSQQIAPRGHRGHNHPPELLEIERPVTQEQFQEVTTAIAEIRRESESAVPNRPNIEVQVSVFRRIAQALSHPAVWVIGSVVGGVIGNRADAILQAHQARIFEALGNAADAVMAWINLIPM